MIRYLETLTSVKHFHLIFIILVPVVLLSDIVIISIIVIIALMIYCDINFCYHSSLENTYYFAELMIFVWLNQIWPDNFTIFYQCKFIELTREMNI